MDDCQVDDGFVEGRTCTFPFDDHTGAKIQSMMLLPEPKWDRPHIVFEKKGETPGHNHLDIASYLVPGRKTQVVSEGDNFYTINARAMLVTGTKGQQSICVDSSYPTLSNGDRICHVYHADNSDIWNVTGENYRINVTVQAFCGTESSTHALLSPGDCFAPLKEHDGKFNYVLLSQENYGSIIYRYYSSIMKKTFLIMCLSSSRVSLVL